jgi:hypothetical protein
MLTLRRSVQRQKLLATEARTKLGHVMQLSTQDRYNKDYGKKDYGRNKGSNFSKDKFVDKVMNLDLLCSSTALYKRYEFNYSSYIL